MDTEMDFLSLSAALAAKEILDVEGMEWMYQLELSGEVLYHQLADRVGDRQAAELLRRNAVEERAHARRMAKALSLKLGREWTPTIEQQRILSVPLPDQVSAEFFLGVVQGEIAGDQGYQRWADLEPDEEVAHLLRLNGREESIHAGRAQQVSVLLSA
jgi:rubrerythrin